MITQVMNNFYNMNIRMTISIIIVYGLLCSAFTFKILEKEVIGDNYSIGTIADISFTREDRIFFRSDDDLFGFLNSTSGELLSVYELEGDERVLKSAAHYELIISDGKNLSKFMPPTQKYQKMTYVNDILSNYNDYTQIIDFQRFPSMMFILTDKYLVQIITLRQGEGDNITTVFQDFKVQQQLSTGQSYFNLVEFSDFNLNMLNAFVTTIIKKDKQNKVCFMCPLNDNFTKKCVDIPHDEVEDIFQQIGLIFIQLNDSVHVYDIFFQKIEVVDYKPIQYMTGFMVLADDHSTYHPQMKTNYSERIVVHNDDFASKYSIKVEDTRLIFSKNNEKVVQISKQIGQNPRKIWSHRDEIDNKLTNIYVQYDNGQLVSYQVDIKAKTYKQAWQFKTISAVKIERGYIQANQNIESNQSAKNESLAVDDQDINEQGKNSQQASP